MTDLTRTQFLETLKNGWGTYIARYRALSPADQQKWLAAQGYARFAGRLWPEIIGHMAEHALPGSSTS